MILYDTKEQKYKLISYTYKTNNGFTVYVATDDKEYGFGKCSDYGFVTESKVVELLNSREEACKILAEQPIDILYTDEAFDVICRIFKALHNKGDK